MIHMDKQQKLAFPGGSVVKNSLASAGDTGSVGLIPGWGRSPGGGHTTHCSILENPMDRGEVGYSPRGLKESDMTEVT